MRFSRTSSLLWLCSAATTAAVTVPAAVGIDPSQVWEGSDGPWSSFPIRVGNPAQDVRVFPSTASTSTWVVGTLGCEGTGQPSNCSTVRGGLFDNTTSSTWNLIGDYYLHVEDNLGYAADEGEFGFDTVGLGFAGSGDPTLNHTTVAWISTFDYFLGVFGLNPRGTNFTDPALTATQPSYITLLYTQSIIPSLSWGYTAGALYRFNKVLGSLTLGGYDEGLIVPNDVSFPFYFDQERDLTVALQSVTATNTTNKSLLTNGILTFIDSTISQIYLPLDACEAFEQAFGLVWDNTTSLYMVNNTQHQKNVAQNSSLTFTIAPTLSSPSSQAVEITFPYAAFDLMLSYPYSVARYFPLVRAANDTQYTLGRTFLQEAYLTVDYHRSNFSVSQRYWQLTPNSHIVDIFPPNTTTSTGSGPGSGSGGNGSGNSGSTSSNQLSSGAVAGIVIGAVVILGAIFAAIWFFLRRRRLEAEKRKADELAAKEDSESKTNEIVPDPYATPDAINELGTPEKQGPPELHGMHFFNGAEVDGTPGSEARAELGGDKGNARYELNGLDRIEGRFELEAPHGTGELMASGRDGDVISPLLMSPESTMSTMVGSEKGSMRLASPLPPTPGEDEVVSPSGTLVNPGSESGVSTRHGSEKEGPRNPRPFSWQRD